MIGPGHADARAFSRSWARPHPRMAWIYWVLGAMAPSTHGVDLPGAGCDGPIHAWRGSTGLGAMAPSTHGVDLLGWVRRPHPRMAWIYQVLGAMAPSTHGVDLLGWLRRPHPRMAWIYRVLGAMAPSTHGVDLLGWVRRPHPRMAWIYRGTVDPRHAWMRLAGPPSRPP